MSLRTVLSLAAAGAVAVALGVARAQETPPPNDGGVQAAMSALSVVDSALVTWARAETVDSEVKRAVLEAAPLAAEVQPDPARGMNADTAAQSVLANAEQRLVDLASKVQRRATELVYGAAAAPEGSQPPSELVEERIDIRSLARDKAPGSLPLAGVPLAGMAASDDRLHGDELGCDADRLADLVTAEVSEEGGASVETIDGTLIVRATPPTIARVRASLEQLAEIAARRVSVELRAWRMKRSLRAELVRLSDGVALSPEAERKLAAEGTLLGEESIVTGDGRLARTWRGDARTYVAEVAGVASGSIDTVGRTLHTGFFAEVVPRVDPGARTATVSVRFALVEPRPAQRVRVLGCELELPEVELARAATTAVVPLGRPVLVGGSFDVGAEGPLPCILSVRATLVPSPRPAAAGAGTSGARPPGERAVAALDKDTVAEIGRLEALLPHIERALAKVRQARERHVEVLDVRDLVVTDTGALSSPRLGIVLPNTPDEETVSSGVDPERLEAVIKRSTGGDEAWVSPAWLGLGRGAILVRHTPPTLGAVHAIVASLRRDRRRVIEVETGVYRTTAARAGELTGSLSGSALARLDAEVAEGEVTLLAGGFVVGRPGEKVSVLAGRERAFVAGTAPLSNAPGSASTVALARTGFRLGARARLERGGVAAEVDASAARIRSVTNHEGPQGTIVQPSIELDAGGHEVLLESGTGFGVIRARSASGVVLLVVRVRGH